jgi:UDP-N-acetylmuramate dehydrogenase
MAAILEHADVLLADGAEVRLPAADLALAYRDSRFKHPARDGASEVVVAAAFRLEAADSETIKARLDDIRRWRQAHQPLGIPSAGSTFRNPDAGPSAGELIDRAGLKGRQIGGASVSEKHANFIVNAGRGSAADVRRLVDLVRATILERDGIDLQPEIEFVGDWSGWPWPDNAGAGEGRAR